MTAPELTFEDFLFLSRIVERGGQGHPVSSLDPSVLRRFFDSGYIELVECNEDGVVRGHRT